MSHSEIYTWECARFQLVRRTTYANATDVTSGQELHALSSAGCGLLAAKFAPSSFDADRLMPLLITLQSQYRPYREVGVMMSTSSGQHSSQQAKPSLVQRGCLRFSKKIQK
jgi:hypothetical protein